MISFDIQCTHGHRFEGWFGSSADYDEQKQAGLLDCPTCGSVDVEKCLTAPNLGRKGNQATLKPVVQVNAADDSPSTLSNATELPEQMKDAINKMAEVQAESLKESKWVGRKFADEARAIHYGETEAKVIHGETSADEAKELAEEGVPVAPLLFPVVPPEAKN